MEFEDRHQVPFYPIIPILPEEKIERAKSWRLADLVQLLRKMISLKFLKSRLEKMPNPSGEAMFDYLPGEILVDIFHRLPLKSIVTCTCVCKTWKSLITQNSFLSNHLSHTIQSNLGNDDASLFLQLRGLGRKVEDASYDYERSYSLYSDHKNHQILSSLKFPLISGPFPHQYSRVVGTCNGLVCIVDFSALDSATVVILNPSIRKYVVLPKPSVVAKGSLGVLFGFGFDFRNQDFKVVRLVSVAGEPHNPPKVEVYSLASRSWRTIIARVPPFDTCETFCEGELCAPQMSINGMIHWVVRRRVNSYKCHNFILSFDVVEESFGELMLPQALTVTHSEVSILASENLVAVIDKIDTLSSRQTFCIWVMKEYGVVESWTEVFHSDLRRYGGILRVLTLKSSGQVVLSNFSGAILLLDNMEVVKELKPNGYYCASSVCYVESLYLIDKGIDVFSY